MNPTKIAPSHEIRSDDCSSLTFQRICISWCCHWSGQAFSWTPTVTRHNWHKSNWKAFQLFCVCFLLHSFLWDREQVNKCWWCEPPQPTIFWTNLPHIPLLSARKTAARWNRTKATISLVASIENLIGLHLIHAPHIWLLQPCQKTVAVANNVCWSPVSTWTV